MATATKAADVIVLGLGAMGAATLWQLAKRDVRVIGIDRFAPPHARGSSHGGPRLTREAVGEGAAYVPLVRRTHAILEELGAACGEHLLIRCGMLMIGSETEAAEMHGSGNFLRSTLGVARAHDIPHEVLDRADLARRFPQFVSVRSQDIGYLEAQSGVIRPEATIAAQLRAARAAGAEIVTGARARRIGQTGSTVRVETDAGSFEAARLVVTAGVGTRDLLGPPFDRLLSVTRQAIHFYEVENVADFMPDRFPSLLWFRTDRYEDYFSAFPLMSPAEGVKFVRSDEGPHVDPDRTDMTIDPAESRRFHAHHAAGHVAGVTPRVLGAQVCFYTQTPDSGFIIDEHPAMDRVTVVSACSGHGFKHSAGIGEAVAERIHAGRSTIDLSAFGLARFAAAAAGP